MTDIFFPEQGLCVMRQGPGELSVLELSSGSLRATYRIPHGIPIRVHRWNGDAEELWYLSNETSSLLSRVHVAGFLSLSAEEKIVFSDKACIVPAQDGLRILWKEGKGTKGVLHVPLSDPDAGKLDGIVAIEGPDGLRAVLALYLWDYRLLTFYERGKRHTTFPEVGMNEIEIARWGENILLSTTDKEIAELFLLPDLQSLFRVKAENRDIICAAFLIPSKARHGMQEDRIGVIFAKSETSGESKEGPCASFVLQIFDIDGRMVSEKQIGSVNKSLLPQPDARVSPDRKFLVVESTYFRQVFQIPSL